MDRQDNKDKMCASIMLYTPIKLIRNSILTIITVLKIQCHFTAATVSIIVQNTAVSLGASVIALMFVYRTEIQPVWNGALTIVIYALIIIAAVIAKLASVTSDIAIERDWIVVLTDGDDRKLASMRKHLQYANTKMFTHTSTIYDDFSYFQQK